MTLRKIICHHFHQSFLVTALCIGVVAGTVMGLVFEISFFGSPVWLVTVVLISLYAYFKPITISLALVFGAGVILALFRVAVELSGASYLANLCDQEIIVTGTIAGDPTTDDAGIKFKLTSLKFGEDNQQSANGSLYVSLSRASIDFASGNTVTLSGTLLKGFGIYAGYLYHPTLVRHLHPEPGDFVLNVRNWFAARVESLISPPESQLGLSYLLGMKSNLPDDLSANLRTVGLTHIVVASGAHLSILVGLARKVFGRLSRAFGLLFSSLFILFFMAMVGWTPSILRAGIMTLLTLCTWYVGRKIAPFRLIVMVAAGTLLASPMFIIDMSWLLSFASFTGIVLLGPRFTKFLYGRKKAGFVAGTIITTVSATIMTLPITLYYYGIVSLISVVANLLILPTLPYAMGLVFLAGFTAGFPALETITSFLATKLLDFHIFIVEFFGQMENLLIKIPPYDSRAFWLYMVVAAFAIAAIIQNWRRRKSSSKNARSIS